MNKGPNTGIDSCSTVGLTTLMRNPRGSSIAGKRAALAYARSVDGAQTGQVYRAWQ